MHILGMHILVTGPETRDLPTAVQLGNIFHLMIVLSLVMTASNRTGQGQCLGKGPQHVSSPTRQLVSRSLKCHCSMASPPLLSQKVFLEV